MRFDRRRLRVLGWLAASLAVLALARGREAPAQGPTEADPALRRAREQVKMLDDLYKTAVVSMTRRYVADQDKVPAIMVAQDVFGVMEKQGWHSARLVDATGEPLNEANAPKSDFEKEAYRAIRSGRPSFEKVVGEGEGRRLLTATVVPVVLKRCGECHNNRKVGDLLGFIRYDLPIR